MDDHDFIDVTLYLDSRNFKHVYKKVNFKYTYKDNYILYNINQNDILNYNFINMKFDLDNLDLYNIEANSMLKDAVFVVKRKGYLNIIINGKQ